MIFQYDRRLKLAFMSLIKSLNIVFAINDIFITQSLISHLLLLALLLKTADTVYSLSKIILYLEP